MRPRERLVHYGARALSDAELLALVLGTGTSREPVEVLAQRMLVVAGGLQGLCRRGMSRLCELDGLGLAKATRLLAAFELGVRASTTPTALGAVYGGPEEIHRAFFGRVSRLRSEWFFAVLFDSRLRHLGEVTVAQGGLRRCAVTVGDTFRRILQEGAASVVFVHNHPSGDPWPSEADRRFTADLVRAGKLLEVDVLDHVIVGAQGYFSFAEDDDFA